MICDPYDPYDHRSYLIPAILQSLWKTKEVKSILVNSTKQLLWLTVIHIYTADLQFPKLFKGTMVHFHSW